VPTRPHAQQSNTDQQISLRSRWSSSTSSRIVSGELVALPPALKPSRGFALAIRCGSTCGLDRVGGRTEFVRRDVRDDPRLAGRIRGRPCRPTQVSGRAHCLAARRPSLHHRDLAAHPSAGMLDRLSRTWVLGLSRLEQVKDVLRARGRPKREEMMV